MKELMENIKSTYESFESDANAQLESGNKAAGTRARKSSLALMHSDKYQLVGFIDDDISKKNSKQIRVNSKTKKRFISGSNAYIQWSLDAKMQLEHKCQGETQERVSEIRLKFFMGDKRKTDLTNKAESVMDLLVDLKVISDDNWFVVPVLTLSGEYRPKRAGCEISIIGYN